VGFYDDQILPRVIDVALGKSFERIRARVASELSGEVLEIGFGSGRNVPHIPPTVSRLQAVDPASVGRKLAERRIAASTVPVEFIGLDGQDLPLAAESVDHVLVTWTLCTIPDVDRALREVYRVLRPGGRLHFVEHGKSPNPTVASWQDRITPAWRRLAGGCHLNRAIPDLLTACGLTTTRMETYPMRGPEVFGFFYEGVAVKD
jgi:ubiquinone/menaquinone biosynthesis C-methylase UbiE